MRIIVASAENSPGDATPSFEKSLWETDTDDLPAAVIASMTDRFSPGTWYGLVDFEDIVSSLNTETGDDEVYSTVSAEQSGVTDRWTAQFEVGQNRAALMICKSVVEHAKRYPVSTPKWIRID